MAEAVPVPSVHEHRPTCAKLCDSYRKEKLTASCRSDFLPDPHLAIRLKACAFAFMKAIASLCAARSVSRRLAAEVVVHIGPGQWPAAPFWLQYWEYDGLLQ